jgi:RNA polymerase sigma-70 factor, ECF subfamily
VIPPETDLRRSLKALYDEHASFVRRVIIRLGAPPSDVDDLLQEVFLVAMKKMGSFEGRSTHRTWLYGVAVRVVIGARRKAKVREFLGLDSGLEQADTQTPASAFERREAQMQIQRALSKMPEKKRAVFILFEVEGLTGEEIAEAVGCPLKTVWTRLYHARQEFLRQLRRQGVMEEAGSGADGASETPIEQQVGLEASAEAVREALGKGEPSSPERRVDR